MSQVGKRQGAGRKPVADRVEILAVRLPKELSGQIPKPKAAWIRQVIIGALENKDKKEGV